MKKPSMLEEDEWRVEGEGILLDLSTLGFDNIEPVLNSTEIVKPKKSVFGNLVDYSDSEDEN